MTFKLQQFFDDNGILREVIEQERIESRDLFFNPVSGGFDICIEDRIRFEYRQGKGVSCQCLPGTSLIELELWHKGSVMGLAAWHEGLIALHVSAVQAADGLVALGGDSGAGKSTLAAALGSHGFPLFADDTLILDRDGDDLVAMPGHKRLKLWDNAFGLTGAVRGEQLQEGIDKYFAEITSTSDASLLPLRKLVMLVEGTSPKPSYRAVRGSEKLTRCTEALYRPELYGRITSTKGHNSLMLEMVGKLDVSEFVRMKDATHFEATTAFIAAQL